MTYARIDDQFTEHPKVLAIGPLGEALWLRGLLYASRNLTDGFVPLAFLSRMGDLDAVVLAEQLEQAGLWHACDGGYRIHDYVEWQRSKEEIAAISRLRAEAGRRGGLARASNQANAKQVASKPRSKTQADTDTDTETDTERKPPLVPPSEGGEPKVKQKVVRAQQVPEGWFPSDELQAWAAKEKFSGDEVFRETAKFVRHHRSKGNVFKDTGLAWQNWMERSRQYGARASPNGSAAGEHRPRVPRFEEIAHRYGKEPP